MNTIETVLAVFDENGRATVIAANDREARVLVRVRQLGDAGVQIFCRVVEAVLSRPEDRRTLILLGAERSDTSRKFALPVGTQVVRLPPWSVIGRVLRNGERDGDSEPARLPIPPRV